VTSPSTTGRSRFDEPAAILLLAITLVLTVLLIRAAGTSDVGMFLIWGSLGQQHGLVDGYKAMVDHWPDTVIGGNTAAGGGEYPPLGFAWLYLVCQLADLIAISHFLAFKIALLVFSFASTGMMWLLFRDVALAATFQAATMLSFSLGYMDVVPAPFLTGALWAIGNERPVLGFVLLLASILLKWQPLIIVPFLLIHMLRISDFRSLGRALVAPLAWQLLGVLLVTVACVWTVFGEQPLRAFLWALKHPFLSGNTLNIAWLATYVWQLLYTPGFAPGDQFSYVVLTPGELLPYKLVFFLFFIIIMLRFIRVERTFGNCLLFAALGVVTYGVWNSAVHENHWFIALVPAMMLAGYAKDSASRWIAILIAVMFNVNLFVFYGITGDPVIARTIGVDLTLVLALIFTAIWGLLFWYAWSVPPRRAHA
jgi:hypothetical protein